MNDEYYEATIYADFETTVTGDTDQTETEVWSAAWISRDCSSEPENVHVEHSIDDFMHMVDELPVPTKIYFHNLKFDGTFILTYLLKNSSVWKEDLTPSGCMNSDQPWKMPRHRFRYTISDKGMWYSIQLVNRHKNLIRIWDSYKIAPLSLKALGKAFSTKHQKLEMEYKGARYAGCSITDNELAYIKNDVLVLKEVMEILDEEGVEGMTIGSACLKEYNSRITDSMKEELFPDLTKIYIPDLEGDIHRTADDFIRKSYHGGFCYCSPKYAGKVLTFVSHADANSHYPSMMHSQSGNYYPIGAPVYLRESNDIRALMGTKTDEIYYFVRFSCSFDIKPNKIPMVQIKDDIRFIKQRNEWLQTSNGENVELTMTRTDFEQFMVSYNVHDLYLIEALKFNVAKGLFDTYIDHWMGIKMTSKGAKRQIAKLFLNNLYGKFSASEDSSYKIAYYVKGKGLRYYTVSAHEKKPGYIAIGSAITSYARNRTEMIAQDNFDDFVYADTDSVVMTKPEKEIKGLPIDPVKLCYWKVESNSDATIFVRQKTYIEHVTHEDGEPVEPYYNIKCAGMGKEPKAELNKRLIEGTFKLEEFQPGLEIDGNLKSKSIDGGTLLVTNKYKMR